MSYYSDIELVKAEIKEIIEQATILDRCISLKKFWFDSTKLKVSQKFIKSLLEYHESIGDIKIDGDDIIPLKVKEMKEKRIQEAELLFQAKMVKEEEE